MYSWSFYTLNALWALLGFPTGASFYGKLTFLSLNEEIDGNFVGQNE